MFAHITSHGATAAAGAVLALLLATCAPPPPAPVVGPDPADPNFGAPRVGYRSTVGPYTSQRPAAPALGREPNEGARPAPKSGP